MISALKILAVAALWYIKSSSLPKFYFIKFCKKLSVFHWKIESSFFSFNSLNPEILIKLFNLIYWHYLILT